MGIDRIDHVGVVVDDIRHFSTLLRDTFKFRFEASVERQGLKALFFSCGDTTIEIIEVEDIVERERRLGGKKAHIEHIALRVTGLDETWAELEEAGIRRPATPHSAGGRRVVWTEPSTTCGITFQLIEHEVHE